MRNIGLSFCFLGFITLAGSGRADASTINCPGTLATGDREFQLTTTGTAVCRAWGDGNLNGSNDFVNDTLDGTNFWTTIDKSDDDNLPPSLTAITVGGLKTTGPNDFSFDSSLWFTYGRIIIGLKTGTADLNPDWAAFELPTGVTSGTWEILAGEQTLAHVLLYGAGTGTTFLATPEPASMLLLGTGLAAAAARLRRRRR